MTGEHDDEAMPEEDFAAYLATIHTQIEAIGILGSHQQKLRLAERLFRQLADMASTELGLIELERPAD